MPLEFFFDFADFRIFVQLGAYNAVYPASKQRVAAADNIGLNQFQTHSRHLYILENLCNGGSSPTANPA